jgi:hypothetical protein
MEEGSSRQVRGVEISTEIMMHGDNTAYWHELLLLPLSVTNIGYGQLKGS